MIPVQITPFSQNAASALPNIGNLNNISGNAPQVPPAIASLPPGTLLRGFVLNRSADGSPILRSEFGDFLLKSSVFLKIGSEVTIRVRASGPQFRADIIEIDGKPVSVEAEQASKKTATTTEQQPQQQRSTSSGDARSNEWQARQDSIQRSPYIPTTDAKGNIQGQLLNAVLLNPNQFAASLQLKQATPLLLKILQLNLPAADFDQSKAGANPTQPQNGSAVKQGAPAAQNPAPQTAGTTTPQQAVPSNAQVATQSAQAAQSYGQHQLGSAHAPGAASQTPTTTAPQGLHQLQVIGHEQDGDAIVQTPLGLTKITTRLNLPVGTTLFAQVSVSDGEQALAAAALPQSNAPTSLLKLTDHWPAFEQLVQHLKTLSGDDANVTIPALPQLSVSGANAPVLQPMQFSSGFFLFFAALRGGDFRNFLSERQIDQLQKAGHGNLLSQVSSEFSQLSRLFADTPSPWQTMFFPVLVDGEVEMVRWFNKKDESNKRERGKEPGSTRFIVELNTSALGELQLDGLYRYQEQANILEMVLRSHSPLANNIQQAIMQIMQDVTDTTGTRASITFQASPIFPEHPLEQVLKDIPDVVA